LAVTDPSIKLPSGISLGDTQAKIIEALGEPASKKTDSLEYELDYQWSFISMRFSRGRLIEMEVSFEHE